MQSSDLHSPNLDYPLGWQSGHGQCNSGVRCCSTRDRSPEVLDGTRFNIDVSLKLLPEIPMLLPTQGMEVVRRSGEVHDLTGEPRRNRNGLHAIMRQFDANSLPNTPKALNLNLNTLTCLTYRRISSTQTPLRRRCGHVAHKEPLIFRGHKRTKQRRS